MPQITINEIDRSIITRRLNTDTIKILIPGIASFGPTFSEDEDYIPTSFTDASAFNRVYGYTNVEHNPIKDDVSRLYASQLIQLGAEVTFVRINEGSNAKFKTDNDGTNSTHININGTNKATANSYSEEVYHTVPKSVQNTKDWQEYVSGDSHTGTNEDGQISTEESNTYCFAPQIVGIEAKYSGSFGNNLLVTFTPLNTSRLSISRQYCTVSVYYVTFRKTYDNINHKYVKTVSNVRQLESKRVTTNPSSQYYFEDVEFDYIKFIATADARESLTLVWSNIEQDPEYKINENATFVPGFPPIPLKYTNDKGISEYNLDAMLFGGSDFLYSQDIIDAFNNGFNGYYEKTKESVNIYNKYIEEIYDSRTLTSDTTCGLIEDLYNTLNKIYVQFKDPYIYDFDFITSGGLLTTHYKIDKDSKKITIEDEELPLYTYTLDYKDEDGGIIEGDALTGVISIADGLIDVHVYMRDLVETRKDCVALFDTYANYDKEQLVDYVKRLNTSYGTVHNPWCYTVNPDTGALILMPPSFIFLHTFMNYMATSGAFKWYPPAGVTRATTSCVVKPKYEIGSATLSAWQNENTARVNPIMKLKNYGYVIYGQYTTLEAIDEFTHTALESLNVRLIANAIKKRIFEVCMELTFEPNNFMLYDKFNLKMDEYLRVMKYNNGLYDYKIEMSTDTVTTDDINELRCPGKVWIAPTRTAEFFDIDFIITDAGADFVE